MRSAPVHQGRRALGRFRNYEIMHFATGFPLPLLLGKFLYNIFTSKMCIELFKTLKSSSSFFMNICKNHKKDIRTYMYVKSRAVNGKLQANIEVEFITILTVQHQVYRDAPIRPKSTCFSPVCIFHCSANKLSRTVFLAVSAVWIRSILHCVRPSPALYCLSDRLWPPFPGALAAPVRLIMFFDTKPFSIVILCVCVVCASDFTWMHTLLQTTIF